MFKQATGCFSTSSVPICRAKSHITLKSAVLDKLLDRLDQIEPGELQGLLSKLVREKGLLQKVFEALREGVLLLDSGGQINFINAAGCRFFGTTPDQAQGESIEQTIRGLEIARPNYSAVGQSNDSIISW